MTLQALKPRFRFTIRALLVLMTLLAIWCVYSMHWIRQRREAVASGYVNVVEMPGEFPPPAPALLWLFGEAGYETVTVDAQSDEELEPVKSLFPEASVEKMPVEDLFGA